MIDESHIFSSEPFEIRMMVKKVDYSIEKIMQNDTSRMAKVLSAIKLSPSKFESL